MGHYFQLAGLVITLIGAVVLAIADAWFSRSVLVYLDVLETNQKKAIEVLRSGGSDFEKTVTDLKRDRNQDRARSLKSLGWAALTIGFVISLVGLWMK